MNSAAELDMGMCDIISMNLEYDKGLDGLVDLVVESMFLGIPVLGDAVRSGVPARLLLDNGYEYDRSDDRYVRESSRKVG